MREVAKEITRREGGDSRGYLYPDGRAIVRLRFTPGGRGAFEELLDIGDDPGWNQFPEGAWFEGSLLYRPKDGRKYNVRYDGMQQIQSFGTRRPANLFETLRYRILPKMEELGYPEPLQYLIRVGLSVDDSKPFTKKDPPI